MWFRYLLFPRGWGVSYPWLNWILPLALVDIILKGMALWRSSKLGQKWWFVALLLVNSLGILPAIYLLTHPGKNFKKKK